MEKNKLGKYLKYALGEIILVVIGILIALQVNNWNEERPLIQQILLSPLSLTFSLYFPHISCSPSMPSNSAKNFIS